MSAPVTDNPPWTMFFDGPLYRRYDEFMKSVDFSKILLSSKLRLANLDDSDARGPMDSRPDPWDKVLATPQSLDPPVVHRRSSKEEEEVMRYIKAGNRRIRRRTLAFVLLGLVVMAVVSAGAALITHFVLIPADTDLKTQVNISFSENGTQESQISDTDAGVVQLSHDPGGVPIGAAPRGGGPADAERVRGREGQPGGTGDSQSGTAGLHHGDDMATDVDDHEHRNHSAATTDIDNRLDIMVSTDEAPSEQNYPLEGGPTEVHDTSRGESSRVFDDNIYDLLYDDTSTFTNTDATTHPTTHYSAPADISTENTTPFTLPTNSILPTPLIPTSTYTEKTINTMRPHVKTIKFSENAHESMALTTAPSAITTTTTATSTDIPTPLPITSVSTLSVATRTTDVLPTTTASNTALPTQTTTIIALPTQTTTIIALPTIKTTAPSATSTTRITNNTTVLIEHISALLSTIATNNAVPTSAITTTAIPITATATAEPNTTTPTSSLPAKSTITTALPTVAKTTSLPTTTASTTALPTTTTTATLPSTTLPLTTSPNTALPMSTLTTALPTTSSSTIALPTATTTTALPSTLPITTSLTTALPSTILTVLPPTTTTAASPSTLQVTTTSTTALPTTISYTTALPTTTSSTIALPSTTSSTIALPTTTTTTTLPSTMLPVTTESTTELPSGTLPTALPTTTATTAALPTTTVASTALPSAIATTTVTALSSPASSTAKVTTTGPPSTSSSTASTALPSVIANTTVKALSSPALSTAKATTTVPPSTSSSTASTALPSVIANTTVTALSSPASSTTNVTTTGPPSTSSSTASKALPSVIANTTVKTLSSPALSTAKATTTVPPSTSSTTASTALPSVIANTTVTALSSPALSTTKATTTGPPSTRSSTAVPTTTLPDHYNLVSMPDVTAYTFEQTRIPCDVDIAIGWRWVSLRAADGWDPVEVKLHRDGAVTWSRSRSRRHDVEYTVVDDLGGRASNVSLHLVVNNVQCRDRNVYVCTLVSRVSTAQARNRLTVVGKPSKKIQLLLGPAVIEDKALRITAIWQGGFPVPWANMSWIATGPGNQTYDLRDYGAFTKYDLEVDEAFCQTTMSHSIVIFPRANLNNTAVTVRPDLTTTKYFVSKDMEVELMGIEPGIERILLIPTDYCTGNAERNLAHPYTPCTKFIRCLPGDIVVQLCPFGTCFDVRREECI